MPSTSKKQHKFMETVAHNPAFAKKVRVPQSVGKDFLTADKGRKFSKGGDTMAKMNPGFMAMMAKKKASQEGSKKDMMMDKTQMMKRGGAAKKMASGGLAAGHKSADGIASKGKTKGKMIKMNMGGKAC